MMPSILIVDLLPHSIRSPVILPLCCKRTSYV